MAVSRRRGVGGCASGYAKLAWPVGGCGSVKVRQLVFVGFCFTVESRVWISGILNLRFENSIEANLRDRLVGDKISKVCDSSRSDFSGLIYGFR